jgi:hypothetical protein
MMPCIARVFHSADSIVYRHDHQQELKNSINRKPLRLKMLWHDLKSTLLSPCDNLPIRSMVGRAMVARPKNKGVIYD